MCQDYCKAQGLPSITVIYCLNWKQHLCMSQFLEIIVFSFFKLHTQPSLTLSAFPSVTSSAKLVLMYCIFGCILYTLYLHRHFNISSFNMLYRRASENLKLVIVSIKAIGIYSYIKNTEKGSACSHTQEEHDLSCLPFPFQFLTRSTTFFGLFGEQFGGL